MAYLSHIEKSKLEDLLGMGGGYVLDFSDASFTSFFNNYNIDINDMKYSENKPSSSKANRLRGFWELEDDTVVGNVLFELIDTAEYLMRRNKVEEKGDLVADCKNIATRLYRQETAKDSMITPKGFLKTDFSKINFTDLPIAEDLKPILMSRIEEIQKCLERGTPLAAILLAGSVLEGLLLGMASSKPAIFNKASASPKDSEGKVKHFQNWGLSDFINVSNEVGVIDNDVKEFSHVLRNFRNYIHPHKQMNSKFTPDNDSAQICVHVMLAAIKDVQSRISWRVSEVSESNELSESSKSSDMYAVCFVLEYHGFPLLAWKVQALGIIERNLIFTTGKYKSCKECEREIIRFQVAIEKATIQIENAPSHRHYIYAKEFSGGMELKFVVEQEDDNRCRWHLWTHSNERLASSQDAYPSIDECKDAVESFKQNTRNGTIFPPLPHEPYRPQRNSTD